MNEEEQGDGLEKSLRSTEASLICSPDDVEPSTEIEGERYTKTASAKSEQAIISDSPKTLHEMLDRVLSPIETVPSLETIENHDSGMETKDNVEDKDELNLGDLEAQIEEELSKMTPQEKSERASSILDQGFELGYRFKPKHVLDPLVEMVNERNYCREIIDGSGDTHTLRPLVDHCLLFDNQLREDLIIVYSEYMKRRTNEAESKKLKWYDLWIDEVKILKKICEELKITSIRPRFISSGELYDRENYYCFSININDEKLTITLRKRKGLSTNHQGIERLLKRCVENSLGLIETLVIYLIPSYMNLVNDC